VPSGISSYPRAYRYRIRRLVERVNASTLEANEALDDALSFVAESNKRIAAMSEGKQ
jgi:hypothetical protein